MIRLLYAIASNEKKPDMDMVRITATDKLLDRGYGRPAQPHGAEPDEPITVVIRRFGDEHPADNEFGLGSQP